MKRINKILGLGIGIVAAFGLASCTNDINEPADVVTPEEGTVENVTLNLVKTPDVVAWSGQQVIGDTRATRGTYTENGNTYYVHDEEVEVNLSLLDQKEWGDEGISDLVTKLSIHVRCATDVEVILPVNPQYIIESDDLLIFMEHFDVTDENTNLGVYGGSIKEILGENAEQTVTYDELNVKLTVSFEDDGIHVKTEGIDDSVINSCREYNNDGINFEIYNYYQTAQVTWEDEEGNEVEHNIVTGVLSDDDYIAIKNALNLSTISFTGTPKYYINAFGWENAETKTGKRTDDCVVKPNENLYKEVTPATDAEVGEPFFHLNGTPYNYIYILKEDKEGNTLEPDHAHGGAVEVPDQGKDDGNDQNQGTETGANGGGDN